MDSFALRLKQARVEQGMTTDQMGSRFGVVGGTIGRWEAGVRRPSLPFLILWADAAGEDLFR